MGKSNAEHQKAYRQKRRKLLTFSLSDKDDVDWKLGVLATYYNKTNKAMLAEIVDWHWRAMNRKIERERQNQELATLEKLEKEFKEQFGD